MKILPEILGKVQTYMRIFTELLEQSGRRRVPQPSIDTMPFLFVISSVMITGEELLCLSYSLMDASLRIVQDHLQELAASILHITSHNAA